MKSPFAGPKLDAGRAPAKEAGPVEPGLVEDEDLGTEGQERDPTIGGPCVDDEQCDDGFDCTGDSCHSDGFCRFEPNSKKCQDDEFCNGKEICDPGLGCVLGEPVSCDDGTPCTIDRCVEKTGECEHEPRDADADGDPDANCVKTGGDCNDANPAVSSEAKEICDNRLDDNCDGEVDEEKCLVPRSDTCSRPLLIEGDSTTVASTEAANVDYASSCSKDDSRDIAIAIQVEEEVVDVELTAIGTGSLALAAQKECGKPETETDCVASGATPDGERVARLRLRGLGRGSHSVLLFTARPQEVELLVRYLPATEPAPNETCSTAVVLPADENVTVDLVGTELDLGSSCSPAAGDLVYFFDLDAPQDVRLFATSLDGYGEPVLSLRTEECDAPADEISCILKADAELFARALPAGRYYVSVSASSTTRVGLTRTESPPSEAPAGDRCETAQPIKTGVTQELSLGGYTDAVATCLPGGREAVFSLELKKRSDVLLMQRISEGDTGAVSLSDLRCTPLLACNAGDSTPVRVSRHGLKAGTYAVASESELGAPVAFTTLTRTAAPPVLVGLSDFCEDALEIPESGGFFQGNTANAIADFSSGCDLGGVSGKGAPDQILSLKLEKRRRVVLDMSGSGYDTLLSVRTGQECPGREIPGACAVGLRAGRSFLDLELEAGQYYLQIDGFAREAGQWALDVYIVDP